MSEIAAEPDRVRCFECGYLVARSSPACPECNAASEVSIAFDRCLDRRLQRAVALIVVMHAVSTILAGLMATSCWLDSFASLPSFAAPSCLSGCINFVIFICMIGAVLAIGERFGVLGTFLRGIIAFALTVALVVFALAFAWTVLPSPSQLGNGVMPEFGLTIAIAALLWMAIWSVWIAGSWSSLVLATSQSKQRQRASIPMNGWWIALWIAAALCALGIARGCLSSTPPLESAVWQGIAFATIGFMHALALKPWWRRWRWLRHLDL